MSPCLMHRFALKPRSALAHPHCVQVEGNSGRSGAALVINPCKASLSGKEAFIAKRASQLLEARPMQSTWQDLMNQASLLKPPA